MKKIALVCLVVVGSLVASPAQLVITEAMSSSGTGGTPDWFELTNQGATALSISSFKVDDNSFAFGSSVSLLGISTIASGESVVFIESSVASDITSFRSFWGGLSTLQIGSYSGSGVGLSSAGDGLVVFNASGTNLTGNVTFGAATTGVSFSYNPQTNTFGALSVAGQFGARTSNSASPSNIGSPGVIPEPSTYALAGLGLVLLAFFRRMCGGVSRFC
jgi:hypothetical protein